MSTQVGYRIRGIAPPELARYPDPVKLMYWGWVVQLGLRAKDRDLAAGLDKDGIPLRPLLAESIKHRKSEVGPTFKDAPPLEPSYGRSRVRSLLTGRAHTTSAEFWWRFDSVSGRSFADILIAQRDEYGRDVFGLSPAGTAWVKARALGKWQAWQAKAGPPEGHGPFTVDRGPNGISRTTDHGPRSTIPLVGRTDLKNMTLMGDEAQIKRAIKAGQFTGFRRLNAVGERWTPSYSAIGSTGQPPATYTTSQRQAVERALGVPFKMQPRAVGRERVVLADVTRLDDALAGDPGFYVTARGRGSGIEGRYEEFQRFLLEARATGKPVEMPRAVIGVDGTVSITDGRHRFAVFRDQGAGVLPVSVPRNQADEFKQQYGATAAQIRAAAGGGRPPMTAKGKDVRAGSIPGDPEPHIERAAGLIRKAGYEVVTDGSVEIQDVYGYRWPDVIAMFHPDDGRIYLNEQHEHWTDPAAYVRARRRKEIPWFSTESKDHIIRHEIAHAKHWGQFDPTEVDAFWNGRFGGEEYNLIERSVGQFAASNTGDFVAEVRAGLDAGKSYPPEIMAIYRRLKGPGS